MMEVKLNHMLTYSRVRKISQTFTRHLANAIHKAKEREFDNVFLLLDKFNPGTDEAKRQLYVAMTRAKRNLNFSL